MIYCDCLLIMYPARLASNQALHISGAFSLNQEQRHFCPLLAICPKLGCELKIRLWTSQRAFSGQWQALALAFCDTCFNWRHWSFLRPHSFFFSILNMLCENFMYHVCLVGFAIRTNTICNLDKYISHLVSGRAGKCIESVLCLFGHRAWMFHLAFLTNTLAIWTNKY